MPSLKLLTAALLAGHTPLLGQSDRPAQIAPPTQADIAAAMHSPWSDYFEGDGTLRGDSARRIGTLGVWDLEGGDRDRGVRLVHAAREMGGITDQGFYLQAGIFLHNIGVLEEALATYEVATERWPALAWAWQGQARVLTALGRHAEAAVAQERLARLRASQ